MDKSLNHYKTVAASVASARELLGLTQTAFGALPFVNASRATISRWERGLDAPDIVQAIAIERMTGKDLRVF